jgi:membrane associated rhomboid family serine protease
MAGPFGGFPIDSASLVALLLAGLVTAAVVYWLDGRRRWGRQLRQRFVLGVPWGTLIVVGLVVFVYLFVQGAAGRLRDPVVVAFRSWSYRYPLGMLTAAFAHSGLSHITGNLLSTIVFAPVAEYAWGHFPRARGSQSFDSYRTNPYARIGAFVATIILVGLATSLFVPGPLIGFSGVVFAFAGFAVVTKPVTAVFAIVGSRVVRVTYYSVQDPVFTREATTRFVEPWWAGIAIQGHALGLLVGVLLGVAVLARRGTWPAARHVWFAVVVFAVSESLYAFYWQLGASRFVMFRGAGLAAIFVATTLVVIAISAADRRILPRSSLTGRQVAAALLLALVLGIGLAAVPYNLVDITETAEDGIEVRDYTVSYAEDVPHGYVQGVRIPVIGDQLVGTVNASGVIVASERRDAWEEVVPAGRLAHRGRDSIQLGGPGWRETVRVNRTTWNAVDAGATYKVFLRRPGQPRRLSFSADPVTVAPTIAGVNVTIEPAEKGYRLNATRNGTTLDRASMPAVNASVRLAGLTMDRRTDELFAVHEDTRIRIARYQRGQKQG